MGTALGNISTINLFITLFSLLLTSSFFSGSETGIMSINRYRLKHLAKTNKQAYRVNKLLEKPDRLLAVILICNNFLNIAASSIATIIGVRLFGDVGVLIATILLTIFLLILGEITPKTLAAIRPETFAFTASLPLKWLLWLLYPFVVLSNVISNTLIKLLGIKQISRANDSLSLEELNTVLNETNSIIPTKHKEMLSSIINLEKMSITDIMVPRTEVIGINLDDDDENIVKLLRSTQHTLIPVYHNDINEITGIIHMRDLGSAFVKHNFSLDKIKKYIQKPYFVPEGTSLYKQLINFQKNKLRMAIVVDEYGDVQGLITLEDILEEIVGEFTTGLSDLEQEIHPQKDGTFLVDGTINVRILNRIMSINLPTEGSKTLSGIITEYLEFIPESQTCLEINNYKMEVIQVQDNMIKTVKIYNINSF